MARAGQHQPLGEPQRAGHCGRDQAAEAGWRGADHTGAHVGFWKDGQITLANAAERGRAEWGTERSREAARKMRGPHPEQQRESRAA